MSRLILVRHAQASAGSEDYDRLSELGWRQARALGRHWAATGLVADRVWSGPCRRQLETAEGVGEVFRQRGIGWPDPEVLAELDEHDGYRVFTGSLPALAGTDDEARAALRMLDGRPGRDLALYYRVYRRVTIRWARGELERLPDGGLEDWPVFRRRADAAVGRLVDGDGRGRMVLAFTSAGPVGVAVGRALDLSDEAVLRLSWVVRNCALTEFLFSGEQFSLDSFNGLPHLTDPRLQSWV